MLLIDPGRTPYDLNFRLFGIPVRVHPFYWLVSALLTFQPPRLWPLQFWAIAMVLVFVSILVHEFGHALTYRRYGARPHVVLHGLGGLAIPDRMLPLRSQRILVSLAGPFAGFVLAALVWLSDRMWGWSAQSDYTWFIYAVLMIVNVGWGVVNLLPVWPLDGGQVSTEICTQIRPRGGLVLAIWISIVVAIAVVVVSLAREYDLIPALTDLLNRLRIPIGLVTAILFGLLAFYNFQVLQQIRSPRGGGWTDDRMSWER
jgi:stage IV sporulation protein FB